VKSTSSTKAGIGMTSIAMISRINPGIARLSRRAERAKCPKYDSAIELINSINTIT
jgi:hypothetical protein